MDGVRFHLENPNAGDSASHENWRTFKHNAGWIYGPVKDEATKNHPCLLPFNELSLEQQRKDVLFRAVVGALA